MVNMIAAHHIALLLLSTAAKGSREHGEIIEQNGAGVWLALGELQLVERESEQSLWQLTERGRVLVEHVLSLPMPERVSAWRMPDTSPGLTIPLITGNVIVDSVGRQTNPPAADDNHVHTSAPVSMLPKVDIPEDPVALEQRANELLNGGYGLNEVREMLKLSSAQAQAFFGAT